jgi:hypothetical protein
MTIRFPGSFEVTLEDTAEELDAGLLGDVACDIRMQVVGDHGQVQIGEPVITCVYVGTLAFKAEDLLPANLVKLQSELADWMVDNDERLDENAREALTDAEEGARDRYWDEKFEESRGCLMRWVKDAAMSLILVLAAALWACVIVGIMTLFAF